MLGIKISGRDWQLGHAQHCYRAVMSVWSVKDCVICKLEWDVYLLGRRISLVTSHIYKRQSRPPSALSNQLYMLCAVIINEILF